MGREEVNEELPVYNRAINNIGSPPHAEAYCRVLAMEVERLVRREICERLCEACACGIEKNLHGEHFYLHKDEPVPCVAEKILKDGLYDSH